jgi:hypothetical protein
MKILRELENPGALKVLRTVEAGCQLKVAFKKGLCFPKNIEELFFWDL